LRIFAKSFVRFDERKTFPVRACKIDFVPVKRFSFPKNWRLLRRPEFEQVKESGNVQRGRLLMLSVLKVDSEADRFRAGFITSRPLGGAVVRNRVRRRLREIVRKHQHEIARGAWIVTIARANAAGATYQQLEAEWLRLARRASILAA
jgi:ribonuclease P protein component